ncbi:hypothetical protein FAGKG844_970003 [Frankia sp. AgKG'84/4]
MLCCLVEAYPNDDLILVSHGAFVAMGLLHLCEHDLDLLNTSGLVHGATPELETFPCPTAKLGRVHTWNPESVNLAHPAPFL